MATSDTTEQTPLEHNLEKAHEALVAAKYMVWAVAGSTEATVPEKAAAKQDAERLEGMIDRVHAMRFLKERV